MRSWNVPTEACTPACVTMEILACLARYVGFSWAKSLCYEKRNASSVFIVFFNAGKKHGRFVLDGVTSPTLGFGLCFRRIGF